MRTLILALTAFSLFTLHSSLFGNGVRAVSVMPLPAKVTLVADATAPLPVTENFTIAPQTDARLKIATARLIQLWSVRTGVIFPSVGFSNLKSPLANPSGTAPTLDIKVATVSPAIPVLGEDESYTLTITSTAATLTAPTTTGALRGLATFTQLLQQNADGFFLPAVTIEDAPRFPWRGLMIDVSRRWHPLDEIKRIIDGMALVKLNVLHLHLCDDQGFRIESTTHPELHEKGSDGIYFTQSQIREIIRYAADRSIRVVPEFDIPGHASAFSVSHPELMSGKPRAAGEPPTKDAPEAIWDGTHRIERSWGIFDMVFDPSNEDTYKLFVDFLGEMSALFPDPYFHIGGDENNGTQWTANARIQAFIKENNLKDNAGIHAYFNNRIAKILSAHGKKIMGWDEIIHPTLAAGSLIQSWRGAEGIVAAARAGQHVILSSGYYIDLAHNASDHYAADPLPADTTLTPAEQKLILGGEATMWSEWTSSEVIDSRIWPRTAAIAERLWSPQNVRDVTDMYRRLAIISLRLDEAGMQHIRNRTSLLHRLAGDRATNKELLALRIFSDATEPVEGYKRGRLQRWSNQYDPLGGFIDATTMDSDSSREFNTTVAALLGTPNPSSASELISTLRAQLKTWHDAAQTVAGPLAAQSPRLKDPAQLATGFAKSIRLVETALAALESNKPQTAAWRDESLAAVDKLTEPNAAAVELPAVKGFKQLITAAAL